MKRSLCEHMLIVVAFAMLCISSSTVNAMLEEAVGIASTPMRSIVLQLSDGGEVSLDVRLVKLSKTISDLLEEVKDPEKMIPLPNISTEVWKHIHGQLERVYSIQNDGPQAEEAERKILTDFSDIKTIIRIAVLTALNYLDIPDLLRLSYRTLLQNGIFENELEGLLALPPALRNPLIFKHLRAQLGPVDARIERRLIAEAGLWGRGSKKILRYESASNKAADDYITAVKNGSLIIDISTETDQFFVEVDLINRSFSSCRVEDKATRVELFPKIEVGTSAMLIGYKDGKIFYSVSPSIYGWDVLTGKLIAHFVAPLIHPEIGVDYQICSPGVIVGRGYNFVTVFNNETAEYKLIKVLSPTFFIYHIATTNFVVCTPPKSFILFVQQDTIITMNESNDGVSIDSWDPDSGTVNASCVLEALRLGESSPTQCILAGDSIICFTRKWPRVYAWNRITSKISSLNHKKASHCLYSQGKIFLLSHEGTISVWDEETGEQLALFHWRPGAILRLHCRDEKEIVLTERDFWGSKEMVSILETPIFEQLEKMDANQVRLILAYMQKIQPKNLKENGAIHWQEIARILQKEELSVEGANKKLREGNRACNVQ